MKEMLRGNYRLKGTKKSAKKRGKKEGSITNIFEHRAFKKLGGSIAFVMKSNKFVWDGDEKTE